MKLDNTTIVALGSLIVSLTTVISSILTAYFTRRSEVQKVLYSSVFEHAYNEWKFKAENDLEHARKTGTTVKVYPFNDWLFFYSRFLPLLQKRFLGKRRIKKFLSRHEKMMTEYYKHVHPDMSSSNRPTL